MYGLQDHGVPVASYILFSVTDELQSPSHALRRHECGIAVNQTILLQRMVDLCHIKSDAVLKVSHLTQGLSVVRCLLTETF